MIKSISIALLMLLQPSGFTSPRGHSGALTIDLTDKHPLITRDIGDNLLLRVVKVSSARGGDFGWDIEVVRKPYDPDISENLLYHSRQWHGPYPSQVEAWQVSQKYFPNERELGVRGYAVSVRISLVEPVVKGSGSEAQFTSGAVKISWEQRR